MKKLIIKPGFEFIFSLSLLAILGLPPLVFGQSVRDEQITIMNGDTTVNGKNIKDLSAKERQDAMKDIGQISSIKGGADNAPMMANGTHTKTMVMIQRQKKGSKDSVFAFNEHRYGDRMDKQRDKEMNEWRSKKSEESPLMDFSRKNTQVFNYTTTDNNGVSTRVTFRVAEPSGALSNMGGTADNVQMDKLDIQDLTLAPEFSAGKTVLMFSLLAKTPAEVMLKDSKGNVLWTDKTVNGNFSKTFPLGLNGVYYLRVKQGGKLEVKKIFKEQL